MSDTNAAVLEVGDILAAAFKPLKGNWLNLLFYLGVPFLLLYALLLTPMLYWFFQLLSPIFSDNEAGTLTSAAQLKPLIAPYLILIALLYIPVTLNRAALFRFYAGEGLRGSFFAYRFGADEVRLYVILLLFLLGVFAAPIGLSTFMVWGGSNNQMNWLSVSGLITLFLILPFMMMFLATRFSLVFAQTFAEKRLRFFGSWQLTRGHFWNLFLAFSVLLAIFAMVAVALNTPANLLFYTQPETGWLSDPSILQTLDPDDVPQLMRDTFLSTSTIIAFVLILLIGTIVNIYQSAAINGAALFAYKSLKPDSHQSPKNTE